MVIVFISQQNTTYFLAHSRFGSSWVDITLLLSIAYDLFYRIIGSAHAVSQTI